MARKILAVASQGGHWEQLMRLTSAFGSSPAVFVTSGEDPAASGATTGEPSAPHVVTDTSAWSPGRMPRTLLELWRILRRERPDVVISTGAAPGLLALLLGKLTGARTVWVDSLANVDRLSLSGRLARPFADLWLTQWPHLERARGPRFLGAVL